MDSATSLARSTPRWEVVHVHTQEGAAGDSSGGGASGDPVVGLLEAVSTTRLLRFKDDIVVRLRRAPAAGAGGGTVLRVDVRSASRVGKGDLGTNAARIKVFLRQLKEELVKRGLHVLS
ncbi:hypothetical protein HXX76_004042 [Chlamydomonas incerta]|uniref:Uncharacterized protein n=1 Tax=Chlamydomonas incerta TaxID=51695 RepID=A0A835TB63_CHLIN|nr:hypothetical protein HXX76_004042 [Chlamydomonas incerta]|eukprot:KAG2439923.1 hypothetical protein HXX76_004042 [Chlamydomonas incerta]